MRKVVFLALLAAASFFALWPKLALAGGGGGSLCAGFGSGTSLTIRDNCFNGVAQFASAGDTLKVTNEGALPHSFTAVDGSFDTGVLDPGESAEVPLAADAIIRVYCVLHGTAGGAGMAGVLIVGDPALQSASGPSLSGDLKGALAARDEALLGKIDGQAQALKELQSDVQATRRIGVVSALAALALALSGATLALVVRRRAGPSPASERQAQELRQPGSTGG
jgi:hypothetical protein